jgi:hypothetical protein
VKIKAPVWVGISKIGGVVNETTLFTDEQEATNWERNHIIETLSQYVDIDNDLATMTEEEIDDAWLRLVSGDYDGEIRQVHEHMMEIDLPEIEEGA